MKIQCNVCEAAEAKVLCCADEAALCLDCDEKVHAANKLASKHQRVLLSRSNSQMPKCDICQDATGYFFCLEDRALLCRKCDVAIHTANTFVSSHQRFLLTGVQVGLDPAEPGASITNGKSHSGEKMSETECYSMSKRGTQISMSDEFNKVVEELLQPKTSYFGGYGAGSIPQWQLDDFLGYNDYNHNGSCMDHDSSKADSGKLGDSDCSSILRSAEDELDDDERLGEVPQTACKVPRTASPPTASGLHWSKTSYDDAAFVPDICSSPVLNSNSVRNHRFGSISKRRRQF